MNEKEERRASRGETPRDVGADRYCCACGATCALRPIAGSRTNGGKAAICEGCALNASEAWGVPMASMVRARVRSSLG